MRMMAAASLAVLLHRLRSLSISILPLDSVSDDRARQKDESLLLRAKQSSDFGTSRLCLFVCVEDGAQFDMQHGKQKA